MGSPASVRQRKQVHSGWFALRFSEGYLKKCKNRAHACSLCAAGMTGNRAAFAHIRVSGKSDTAVLEFCGCICGNQRVNEFPKVAVHDLFQFI